MQKRNPEETRSRILAAAITEFAANGFGGGRVDAIAARSRVNKRMIYHYFGNKEGLFIAALEDVYDQLRSHERELNLSHLDPREAIERLVIYTFDYFMEHPETIQLFNNENLYNAEHIRKSDRIRAMHSPLVAEIESLLVRGVKAGLFRAEVDPVQLYVTIASVSYFYLSNSATLGVIFVRNLRSPRSLAERRRHVVEVVLGYLSAPAKVTRRVERAPA